jgi:hypothetical protein
MKRCRVALRAMIALLFVAGLLLPAALRPQPALAATKPCPYTNPTMANLETLAGGYLADTYGTDPMLVVENGPACYASRTLRFTAFVRDPGEVGWTYTYGLEPGWFRTTGSLFVATTSDVPQGHGPFTALAVPPGLGELQAKHVGHWVVVSGHFDDPAAATCVASGDSPPPAPDVVTICRSTFVVESVTRTEPPSTSTAAMELPTWWSAWLAVSAAFGGVATLWITGRRRRG